MMKAMRGSSSLSSSPESNSPRCRRTSTASGGGSSISPTASSTPTSCDETSSSPAYSRRSSPTSASSSSPSRRAITHRGQQGQQLQQEHYFWTHRLYRLYLRNFRFLLLCHLPLLLVIQWDIQRGPNSVIYETFSSAATTTTAVIATIPNNHSATTANSILSSSLLEESLKTKGEWSSSERSNNNYKSKSRLRGNGQHVRLESGEGAGAEIDLRNASPSDSMNEEAFISSSVARGAPQSVNSSTGSAERGIPAPDGLHEQQQKEPNHPYPVVHTPLYETTVNATEEKPLSVVLIGTKETMRGSSSWLHAIEKSKYVRVIKTVAYSPTLRRSHIETYHNHQTTKSTSASKIYYIVDWSALSRDCHILRRILFSENATTTTTFPGAPANDYDSYNNHTYLLYLDASSSSRTVVCPPRGDGVTNRAFSSLVIPIERTRYAKQNLVENRYWSHTKQWVELGNIINNRNSGGAGPLLHMPQYLRETFVEQLRNATNNTMDLNNTYNISELPNLNRKTHVAHFWRKGGNLHYAFLRRRVSSDLVDFADKHQWLRCLVRIFGDEKAAMDHHQVNLEYVQQLISSQIVVVAQHDEWEDHYQLMEALAGGAMVMSDAMLSPPMGLEDKVNIVFYDSSASLERSLLYYLDPANRQERLAIAQQGMEFALRRQRGWHRIEELLFGEALTGVYR